MLPCLTLDLIVASLLVACDITIHLIHTDTDLLNTKQIDQACMLPCLTLDLACFMIALGDGSRKIAIAWHHDQGAICLRSTSDHILDEITMAWSIDNGVVPLFGVELLGSAGNGHTTLALFLLAIHVECKSEGTFAQALSFLLQLLQLTLGKATQFEDQPASCCTLAAVDMTQMTMERCSFSELAVIATESRNERSER